jgi:hypothetical protein
MKAQNQANGASQVLCFFTHLNRLIKNKNKKAYKEKIATALISV